MSQPARILTVDDEASIRLTLAAMLRRAGYDVTSAESGEEAVALLGRQGFDLLLVDLKMPGDSGLALVPKLGALASEMRIVVLTGYASVTTAVEAIKLGATHYLAKPVDADAVVAAFGRVEGDPAAPLPPRPLSVDRLEWEHIQRVLAENGGSISATARSLGMHRRTLQRKLAKRPVRA